MRVFHGSYLKINEIDLNKCEPRKDFGQGFYVTKYYRQAEIWAKRIARNHHTKPVITEFDFFENVFLDKDYKTLRFDTYNNEWLDFVTLNRDFNSPLPAHDYDIVEGPVADDKITIRIDAYMRGDVLREDFLQELIYEKPTHQICFSTLKSLLMLVQIDFKGITAIEQIGENLVGKLIADFNYSEIEAADIFYNSTIHRQLSNKSTELYLKPWKEIYEMLKIELKIMKKK
ncbi:MAG: DUF3990 domain-containing protein, partial [Bacteroidales bacterium]|nr:DUF3990 domain-containing protein [Bacteroidales bacterium]